MSARILVTFGSKRGGTAEIAEWIASSFRARGFETDCLRASEVRDVRPYDAVVLGGALYAQRWAREAVRFARRHRAALRQRGVWLFSSGPLDESATSFELSPPAQVVRIAADLGARDHATFGGRLTSDAQGFIAHAMAKNRAGDWRDRLQIEGWATRIADAVPTLHTGNVHERPPQLLAGLGVLAGVLMMGIGFVLTAATGARYLAAAILLVVCGAGGAMLAVRLQRSWPAKPASR